MFATFWGEKTRKVIGPTNILLESLLPLRDLLFCLRNITFIISVNHLNMRVCKGRESEREGERERERGGRKRERERERERERREREREREREKEARGGNNSFRLIVILSEEVRGRRLRARVSALRS